MSRIALTTVIIFLIGSFAIAQDPTPRFQVFGGYSLLHTDNGGLNGPLLNSLLEAPNGTFGLNSNFNGWNAEAQYNANRWLGLVADFSGHYGEPLTVSSGSGITGLPGGNEYSFLFGPVVTYKSHSRLEPFAHALFGFDRMSLTAGSFTGLTTAASGSMTDSAFGMTLGGGIDYKLFSRVAIRLGQADYFYTNHDLNSFYGGAFGPGLFSGLATHENNFRFSTGIVIKF